MKLKRKNPCKECPFKKTSLPGWLGPWTIDLILSMVHGEGGLACHMQVVGETVDEKVEKSHICVGSLQHANKTCKTYRNPELQKLQHQVGAPDDILNYQEFKAHHKTEEEI